MSNYYREILTAVLTVGLSSVSFAQDQMTLITDNITNVCDKPASAGEYWDIQVKGSGEANLKLVLPRIGVTGDVEFNKKEWTEIQNTVENSIDYRECVERLTPIFVKRFSPAVTDATARAEEEKEKKRSLGGIKWTQIGAGVQFTLETCELTANVVTCGLTVTAIDSDAELRLNKSSVIFDQQGHKYEMSFASVANFSTTFNRNSYLVSEIVQSVDTPVVLRFGDVSEEIVSVSKASIVTRVKTKSGTTNHSFDFRKVEIQLSKR